MSDISGQDLLHRKKVVTSLPQGQSQYSHPLSSSDTELVRKTRSSRKQKPLQKGQTLLGNFCEILRTPQTDHRNTARVLADLSSQDRGGPITSQAGCQRQRTEVKGQLRQTKGSPVVVGKVLSAKLLPGEETGTGEACQGQGLKTDSEESGRTQQKMTVVGKVMTIVGKVVEKSSLQNTELVHKSSLHDVRVNQKTLSQALTTVQKIPSQAMTTVQKIPSQAMTTVQQTSSQAMTTVQKIPSQAVTTVQKTSSQAMTTVQKIPSQAMTTVQKTSSQAMTTVQKTSSQDMTTVQKILSQAMTTVQKTSSQAMTTVQKTSSQAMTTVQKILSQAMTTVQKIPSQAMTTVQKTSSQDMEIVQTNSRPDNDSAQYSSGVYPMSPPWSLSQNTLRVSPKKALVSSVPVRTPTKRKSPCVDELDGTMAVPCKKQKVLAGSLLHQMYCDRFYEYKYLRIAF